MSLPHAPLVSVVIVSWNSATHLPRCLDALHAQTFRDFEVIIVDNASSDASTSVLSKPYSGMRLRLEVLPANVGFAAASNTGARLANGKWLALLNPDAFAEPDWLEGLVGAAELHPGCFLASRQIQANQPTLLDGEGDVYYTSGLALRQNYNVLRLEAGPPQEVFSACAAAALYPREEFLGAGGFDEDYFAYYEDVDLGFRLRLRGLRCLLVPAASVHHVGAASSGPGSTFARYHGQRNLIWTYAKNMPTPWLWLYLPFHLLLNLVSIFYFIGAGQGPVVLRAKLDAVRGLPRMLDKRRAVQASRRIAAAEIVRPMDRNPLAPLQGLRHRLRAV